MIWLIKSVTNLHISVTFYVLKKIPDVVVDGYYSKSISSSHIYVLSRLNDKKQMIDLYEKILGENYTVKQTEMAVREYLYQVKSVGKYINKESTEKLTQKLGKNIRN